MLGMTSTPRVKRGYAPSTDTRKLLEELERNSVSILRERLDTLFDSADDLLFEMAERASDNQKQLAHFDTIRVIRLGRRSITDTYCQTITAMFRKAPQAKGGSEARNEPDEEPMAMQDSRVLERDIAISNMCTKAHELYKQEVWEIGRRVAMLIEERHAEVSAEMLTPHSICLAFRDGIAALEISQEVELIIYKLFDRCVISQLKELYTRTLHTFKQWGFKAQPVVIVPGAAGARASNPAGMVPPVPQDMQFPGSGAYLRPMEQMLMQNPLLQGPVPQGFDAALLLGAAAQPQAGADAGAAMLSAGMDAETLQVLAKLSGTGGMDLGRQYGNVQLATDLSSAAAGQAVAHWPLQQALAYVQRASLVGRLFNGILDDPNLPAGIKPQFEQLRFAVIKSALKDSAFIHDPQHPVRGLMHELVELASHARVSGLEQLKRIEEMVGQIQTQFEVAAQSVREPAPDLKPVDPETAARFVNDLEERAEQRRRGLVQRVRALVSEELRLHTLGLETPPDVKTLLQYGWGPMMAMTLLRHGADSAAWTRGMKLLDLIVRACDLQAGMELRADTAGMQGLLGELRASLLEVGLKPERVQNLLIGFERAIYELRAKVMAQAESEAATTPVPAKPADAAAEAEKIEKPPKNRQALLETIVQPGVWFRIHDPKREGPRWLKAVTYYEDKDRVMFAEFNGRNSYCMRGERLIEDLLAERSHVLDPPPAVELALMDLKAQAIDELAQADAAPQEAAAQPAISEGARP
jgi:hypothetical protein